MTRVHDGDAIGQPLCLTLGVAGLYRQMKQ
ncbi:hypothetical protein BC793_1673 [Actinoplanes xinjiangensis]|uniref:Uncharacterized protein n=1 Tax=Actinoplanes xinjiangensis TaxID=512350 RepID=A0A316E6T6_9ACTN|nr:hypothetical protein BC793_1673 [Actinoplanes xinjiangensis]